MNVKIKKIPKGYRLRPETHELIKRLQNMLDTSIDTVIYKACSEYYIKLKKIYNESN